MKKIIFVLSLMVFVSAMSLSFVITDDPIKKEYLSYCDGWEDGYCEGWRDIKGELAICPITPICPIELMSCPSTYNCGYNRGFLAGRAKAKK